MFFDLVPHRDVHAEKPGPHLAAHTEETPMKNLLTAAVALAGLLSITPERANAQASTGETSSHVQSAKLENSDVLDMVKAGLPEEVIIAKIQGSPCNFDTSPASLATLKSSQVPNAVILAVVKKSSQTNSGEERDASSSSTRSGTPSPTSEAAKANAQQSSPGCMAVKPIGTHALRNVMLVGVAGAFISHMQYQVVDAVEYPAKVGQKFHGNDLQTIQGSGTKVVLLAKHYTAEDLHMACHQ
jgi:hypothetical protein